MKCREVKTMLNREYKVVLKALLKTNLIAQRDYEQEVSALDIREDMAEAQLRSAIREYMEASTRAHDKSVLNLYKVVKEELEKGAGA